jgi:hypothetical protein
VENASSRKNSEEERRGEFSGVDCQKRAKKAAQKTLYLFLHNKYSIQTQPA